MSQRDDYGDVPQVLAEPDREVAGGTRGVGETAYLVIRPHRTAHGSSCVRPIVAVHVAWSVGESA